MQHDPQIPRYDINNPEDLKALRDFNYPGYRDPTGWRPTSSSARRVIVGLIDAVAEEKGFNIGQWKRPGGNDDS